MRVRAAAVLAVIAFAAAVPGGTGNAASPFAYFNSADSDRFFPIARSGPTPIAGITLQTTQPSNVLVQFTSGATAETTTGCPCSLRAFLRMDGGPLMPVKRINLGSPGAMTPTGYPHDRQSLDGSLVFPTDAGTHLVELVVQQVTGTSEDLRLYYPNLQAMAFPQ